MADAGPVGVLLVDLDGTLYTGDGPVLRYAAELAAVMPAEAGRALRDEVDRYLAGAATDPLLTASATDGWEAVQLLAGERHGVHRDIQQRAFLASRRGLADGTVRVRVPDGLADALAGLRGRVRLVLATNSPSDGLAALLDRIGMAAAFDEVVPGAAKPGGLPPLLGRALAARGLAPHRAFSIGDHWRNDIAPALVAGAMTGYVDRFGRADGPSHVSARTVPELLPALAEWAADPDSFAAAHRLPA